LALNFVAGGPAWRRVQSWDRPSLEILATSFDPKLSQWTELERFGCWEFEDEEGLDFSAGYVEASYFPKGGSQVRERSFASCFVWRVLRREAGLFTVEMAGFADRDSILAKLEEREALVSAEGKELVSEPDEEFWRMNSAVYLVEQVPFGTVTVRVPRNAKDVEAFALARARALIGVEEAECVETTDYSKWEKPSESLRDDIFVELHFNGYFED
jgi:hypothetical protein